MPSVPWDESHGGTHVVPIMTNTPHSPRIYRDTGGVRAWGYGQAMRALRIRLKGTERRTEPSRAGDALTIDRRATTLLLIIAAGGSFDL